MKQIFRFDTLKLFFAASLIFLSIGLSAQNYVSPAEATEALADEMERIANATQVLPSDNLVEDMAKELRYQISVQGVPVSQAMQTLFNYYESKKASWPHVNANLSTARAKIEELLIE